MGRHLKAWPALVLGLFLYGCEGGEPSDEESAEKVLRPNILLLYLDDLGYNDLGSYSGNKRLPTAALDELAREGVRFTRHYADSTCSPARAALLTGRYPARFGYSPNGPGLSPQIQSLPKELKKLGYSTHHVGKWHIGHRSKQAWPDAIGFDTWVGFLSQWLLRQPHQYPYREDMFRQPSYWDPWLNDETHQPKQYKGHLSDILADKTIELIRERKHHSQPWFINHWFYQPHTPLQPTEPFAQKYQDTPEGRYLAVLEQLDQNVGRIMEALEESGQLKNTLIVVASDNGGTNKQRDNNWPFYGKKAEMLEGALRTPLIIRWPDSKWQGEIVDTTVSIMDVMPTLLAVAGGEPSEPLDGRDIAELVAHAEEPVARALFWEVRYQDNYSFGALSADGEWRAQSYLLDGPPNSAAGRIETGMQLYALKQEPRGETDVIERYPETASTLLEDYIRWFREVHQVPLTYERLGENGVWRISGDDFQRTLGYGPFAWVVGVQPATTDHRAQLMTIAEQEGVWSMEFLPGKRQVTVDFGGRYQLRAVLPESDSCQSLLITGDVAFRLNHWGMSRGYMSIYLYVDGERMDSVEGVDITQLEAVLSHPTYVGRDSRGENTFSGKINSPLLYNVIASERNYLPPSLLHQWACPSNGNADQ